MSPHLRKLSLVAILAQMMTGRETRDRKTLKELRKL